MKKISVIVPAYNMEDFLEKCLNSLINQTYQNLEIIVVNDCSSDKTLEICNEFCEIDERIKVISNKTNQGLFHTRIIGTKVATGDYIAFVDADDYLTLDFYRVLLTKSDDADIAIGNTILETEDNWKYIQNVSRNFTKHVGENGVLKNHEILNSLMDGEGLNFSWHTVWNKLYKKELWDTCVPHFEKIENHLIMTEDIVFSTVLYSFAKKLKFVDIDGYVYYRHSKASTGEIKTIEKLEKTIRDVCTAFSFVEAFLKSENLYETHEKKFLSFRQRYYRFWSTTVENYATSKRGKELRTHFLATFCETEPLKTSKDDHFFESIVTGYEQNYIFLKEQIIDKNIKYVSFDIFDTLILRPFLEPSDLFLFMQTYYTELTGHSQNFAPQRLEAESIARQKIITQKPSFEDVNIDEIYESLEEIYGYSKEICDKLKDYEIELELKYCYVRESIKELYELALHMKKEVIIVSDMYLPQEVIAKILHKNGYKNYTKLYVSSETRVLKHTQNMFKHVCRDLQIKNKKSVLHIGDNMGADITAGSSFGFNTFHTPKTKDIFLGATSYKKNHESKIFSVSVGDKYNNINARKNLSVRCMLAVIANKIFDNPFVSYSKNSAINADPYYLGYYLLGMNMYSLATWLKKADFDTIHFIARDGFLPKKVYDIISDESSPKSNYLYASRKSLLPSVIHTTEDLLILPEFVQIKNHSPESLLKLLKDIILPVTGETEKLYKEEGVIFDSKFTNTYKYLAFVKAFEKLSFSEKKIEEYQKNAKTYFNSEIKDNDCTFDLGYSGKIQKLICGITEKSIKAYFLHGNGAETEAYATQHSFEIDTFYQTTPSISGILREYLVSDYNPSCVGYTNDAKPVFDQYVLSYSERYILDQVHKGTIEFTKDFTNTFGDRLEMFNFHPIECSQALEHFLTYPTAEDMKLFASSYVEDDVHSGEDLIPLNECWKHYLHTSNIGVNNGAVMQNPDEIDGIYSDGLIIALAKKINSFFPEGGRKRKYMKKIINIFVK